MSTTKIRIGMWSGPRNISTAMMRSWENRTDTIVVDEPLYGPYLDKTKKLHPMWEEIIRDQGKDEYTIIEQLTMSDLPVAQPIYYQKQMCHHILEDMDISWIKNLTNVFLIRDPNYVLSSYLRKYPDASPENLGYPQQSRLFNYVIDKCGYTPIVMDSKDILQNPQKMMELLCTKLEIPFQINMMSWPKGYRESDGVWAPHWYNRVIESTGFSPYSPKIIDLSEEEKRIADDCQPYYQELLAYKLI